LWRTLLYGQIEVGNKNEVLIDSKYGLKMKNKIVLIFLLLLMALFVFNMVTKKADTNILAIETETTIETTAETTIETTAETTIETTAETVVEENIDNTEVTEETLPIYMDTSIVANEMSSRSGMIGRLTIPSVGLDVALFNRYTQGIVDRQDSAGTYRYNGGQMVIADHKNQGFELIKLSIPNVTIAYINDGETVKPYICIDNNIGENKSNGIPYDLLDCNGDSIYLQNAGGICIYTCNNHWSSITYTYWQPIEDIN
jgi:hypothetical protein